MIGNPKPEKRVKTIEDKLRASQICKRHGCPKWQCHPHKPSKAKPRKPIVSKKPIRVKPKADRRKLTRTERSLLEAELVKLCSEYVRKRDLRCVTCGSRTELTCSHFIKRAVQVTTYDLNGNLNCQCKICNEAHNHDETQYEKYIVKTYGKEKPTILRALAGITYFKWSVVELRNMVDETKKKLEEL